MPLRRAVDLAVASVSRSNAALRGGIRPTGSALTDGMSTARFIVGDVLTELRAMPAASVDLVLTSSPFLALRSYLPADHPDKALEVGVESTPGEFIDHLLDIVEELRRVLARHGSLAWSWVHLQRVRWCRWTGRSGGADVTGQAAFTGSAQARRQNGDYYPRPNRNGRRNRTADVAAAGSPRPDQPARPQGRDLMPRAGRSTRACAWCPSCSAYRWPTGSTR